MMKKNKKQPPKKPQSVFVKTFKIIGKILLYTMGSVLVLVLAILLYVNLPVKENDIKVPMGATFSLRYAQDIGLDWRQAYLAVLDDLQMKYIRIPVYWDLIEKSEGQYDFSDLDWQLDQARAHGAHIVLAMGEKVPRWPECFVPAWVGNDSKTKTEKLLAFEKTVIERYKNNPEIARWQTENEPFLDFGVCGTISSEQLDAEIAQVKILDKSRPVVVTDSGELSLWLKAAKRADIFGTTMYREVYSKNVGHWRYPIGPNFFKLKRWLIRTFVGQQHMIVIELQGEPWVQGWTTAAPVDTQLASMNAEILKDNVSFAKKTGAEEIYVWGVEWWYWMKTIQHNDTLWSAAKEIYKQ